MLKNLFKALRQNFRKVRYQQINSTVKLEKVSSLILDLGGGPASFFAEYFPNPRQVVLLEITPQLAQQAKRKRPDLHVVIADGECLPFAKQSLALIICNSVIEHVNQPQQLAQEIRRVGKTYFLQTPNGNFPLETHSYIGIPFYNFIPFDKLRRVICRLFGANYQYLSSVRYIPETTLRQMFPEAIIGYERFLGLKKSYYVHKKVDIA